MTRMLRWIIRITVTLIFICVLLVVALVLLKDVLAKSLTERNLRDGTGMDAQIAKMEIGLATPTMNMEGLKIYNPAGFGGGTFLDLPLMRVEYDTDAVSSGKIRFKTLRVHLAELHIIRDKNGVSNLDLMEKKSKQRRTGHKDKDDGLGDNFGGIETMYLTIDTLKITDLGDPRKNQVLNIGMKDAVMRNMKTEKEIKGQFLWAMLPVMITNAVVRENLTSSFSDLFNAPKRAKQPRADSGTSAPSPVR